MDTPRYGHAPIKMRRVSDDDAIERAGDFAWRTTADSDRHLMFAVPRPHQSSSIDFLFQCIPVKQGPNETGRYWGWDGNEDTPTLTPSVHAIGHWHGWVRAGELIEA